MLHVRKLILTYYLLLFFLLPKMTLFTALFVLFIVIQTSERMIHTNFRKAPYSELFSFSLPSRNCFILAEYHPASSRFLKPAYVGVLTLGITPRDMKWLEFMQNSWLHFPTALKLMGLSISAKMSCGVPPHNTLLTTLSPGLMCLTNLRHSRILSFLPQSFSW